MKLLPTRTRSGIDTGPLAMEPTSPASVQDAARVVARVRGALDSAKARHERDMHAMASALRRGSLRQARRIHERLAALAIELRTLKALGAQPATGEPEIVLSSWMLMESFRICTETPDEGMHFIVGTKVDSLLVGMNIVQHPYTARSPVGAAAEQQRTHATVIEAAETGHQVLVIAHAHPGKGPGANLPSGTDLRTHRLWESLGPICGAIWARCGHVRFFTAGRPVRVSVVGSHLVQVDRDLWRIRDEFASDRQ